MNQFKGGGVSHDFVRLRSIGLLRPAWQLFISRPLMRLTLKQFAAGLQRLALDGNRKYAQAPTSGNQSQHPSGLGNVKRKDLANVRASFSLHTLEASFPTLWTDLRSDSDREWYVFLLSDDERQSEGTNCAGSSTSTTWIEEARLSARDSCVPEATRDRCEAVRCIHRIRIVAPRRRYRCLR